MLIEAETEEEFKVCSSCSHDNEFDFAEIVCPPFIIKSSNYSMYCFIIWFPFTEIGRAHV